MDLIKNEKQLPKIYYGLHFSEGVAEYKEPQINDGSPYRILLNESTIKQMDATFAGRPVYVQHVDEVKLDTIKNDADGYVVESFFNKVDGKHWVKFIVVSDRGHDAIKNGWKLSNAYLIKKTSGGGMWHGVEYSKEVTEAEYEHLAIVPNPRYEESKVLTPEEFKAYNEKKEIELKKLYNSKNKEKKSMFSFFKKTKVENTADFENTSVILPKSEVEKTLSQIINEADESAMKEKEEHPMANMDHHVKVNGKMMKLQDAMKHYHDLLNGTPEHEKKETPAEEKKEHEPKNEEKPSEEEKKPEGEEAKEIHVDIDSHKEENKEMSDEEAKKKALELAKHEEDEMAEEKKEKKQNHFDAIKNAESNAITATQTIELSEDRVARGKARYGSN